MSQKKNFTQVPNKAIRGKGLTVYERVVFSYIISFHPSYPSISNISSTLTISRDSVNEAIKGLVNKKMLTYKKGDFKSKKSNEYTMLPDNEWQIKEEEKEVKKTTAKVLVNNLKTKALSGWPLDFVTSMDQQLTQYPDGDVTEGKANKLEELTADFASIAPTAAVAPQESSWRTPKPLPAIQSQNAHNGAGNASTGKSDDEVFESFAGKNLTSDQMQEYLKLRKAYYLKHVKDAVNSIGPDNKIDQDSVSILTKYKSKRGDQTVMHREFNEALSELDLPYEVKAEFQKLA